MSLAALAHQTPPRNAYHARGCRLGRWIATLSTDEQAGIRAMFDARTDQGTRVWTNRAIADQITTDPDYPGVTFKADAIAYHRNGGCGCESR